MRGIFLRKDQKIMKVNVQYVYFFIRLRNYSEILLNNNLVKCNVMLFVQGLD